MISNTRRRFLGAAALLGGAACVRNAQTLPRVDEPSPAVQELAEAITAGATSPRERAIAIYRFVRDEIRFGFTPYFDEARPGQTLDAKRGHCNPTGVLFASLLHAVNVDALLHFVTIDNRVLHGLGGFPARLNHAYTEVRLDGGWIPVDGYIVDPALFAGARAKLERSGRRLGWGMHRDAVQEWDGREAAMGQLCDPAMVLEDHGTYVDALDFFQSEAYSQRLGGVAGAMYRWFGVDAINRAIDNVRA